MADIGIVTSSVYEHETFDTVHKKECYWELLTHCERNGEHRVKHLQERYISWKCSSVYSALHEVMQFMWVGSGPSFDAVIQYSKQAWFSVFN